MDFCLLLSVSLWTWSSSLFLLKFLHCTCLHMFLCLCHPFLCSHHQLWLFLCCALWGKILKHMSNERQTRVKLYKVSFFPFLFSSSFFSSLGNREFYQGDCIAEHSLSGSNVEFCHPNHSRESRQVWMDKREEGKRLSIKKNTEIFPKDISVLSCNNRILNNLCHSMENMWLCSFVTGGSSS